MEHTHIHNTHVQVMQPDSSVCTIVSPLHYCNGCMHCSVQALSLLTAVKNHVQV